jgi:hypothetical protein
MIESVNRQFYALYRRRQYFFRAGPAGQEKSLTDIILRSSALRDDEGCPQFVGTTTAWIVRFAQNDIRPASFNSLSPGEFPDQAE